MHVDIKYQMYKYSRFILSNIQNYHSKLNKVRHIHSHTHVQTLSYTQKWAVIH
jgi:hypothetical protein